MFARPSPDQQRARRQAEKAANLSALAAPSRAIRTGVRSRCDAASAPIPKDPHTVNPHLRNLARGQECLLQSPVCCRDPETTVACHGAGIAAGKGLGYKVGDHLTVWGCWRCNDFTDAYKGATAEEKAAVFAAGYARQVKAWQDLAASTTEKPWKRQAAKWALDELAARA